MSDEELRQIPVDDEILPSEPPEMVHVCTQCGRGFPYYGEWHHVNLPHPSSIMIDGQAKWWIGEERGPECGGRVMRVHRETHVKNIGLALLQISIMNQLKKKEGSPL